jgi:GntR family transcriptional regulator
MTVVTDRSRALAFLKVQRGGMTPHHQQLEAQLSEAITNGWLKAGDALPSERDLAEGLGISRMTVRRALTGLEAQGLIRSQVGKGWYVSPTKIEQVLAHLVGFTDDMRARGFTVGTQLLDFRKAPAPEHLAEKLGIAPGEAAYFLDRLRLIEGEPVGIEYARVSERVCPRMEQFDFGHDSLYRVMREEYALTLGQAVQEVEASAATWHEAMLLKIDVGAPVLRSTRVVYSPEGVVLEASSAAYRGDRYKYEIRLRGGT